MELKHEDSFFSKDFDGFVELFQNEMTFDDSVPESEQLNLLAKYATAYELALVHNDLVNFLKLINDARQSQLNQANAFQKQMEQSQKEMEKQNKDFEKRYKDAGLDKQADVLKKAAKQYSDTLSELAKKLQKETEDQIKKAAEKAKNKNNLTVLTKDGEPIGEVKTENTVKPESSDHSDNSDTVESNS